MPCLDVDERRDAWDVQLDSPVGRVVAYKCTNSSSVSGVSWHLLLANATNYMSEFVHTVSGVSPFVAGYDGVHTIYVFQHTCVSSIFRI